MTRAFAQVDVFGGSEFGGNPVAVVLDGNGLSDERMQQFASWTNLSETTFVLPPTTAEADYRVRIFTPDKELPFAGHPTLGTCHAWLEHGGRPADPARVVQECAAGLIVVDTSGDHLAFSAPPLIRSGPVDEIDLAEAITNLGISADDVVDSQWVDNGPGWLGLLLTDVGTVLSIVPGPLTGPYLGVAALAEPTAECAYEVRAFFSVGATTTEDPITGSLNASLAQWLVESGRVTPPYRVRQGTALGRSGVVTVGRSEDGTIWVGGDTVTRVDGTVAFDG